MVLRADWQFREGWESLVEARTLDLPDVNQTRTGALVAVYRYLGEQPEDRCRATTSPISRTT